MDFAPSSAPPAPPAVVPGAAAPRDFFGCPDSPHPAPEIPALHELYLLADGAAVGLTPNDFTHILLTVGDRCHYSQPPALAVAAIQREAFFRSLHLADLALAHACALGSEPAWQLFLARFRQPLAAAAIAITGSASLGRDLAEALPAELFGLSTRAPARHPAGPSTEHPDGQPPARRSPLASYSGRGSLLGWLRSTLAQRHIDRHRRTHRETPLADLDTPAAEPTATTPPATLQRLQQSLTVVLRELPLEDAFVLSAWFLDGRTLLEIARLLRVSEATVSRRAKRLTAHLRTELSSRLQAGGLSRRAAEEALGADPRDLTLNLRVLLQNRAAAAFQHQTPQTPPTNSPPPPAAPIP